MDTTAPQPYRLFVTTALLLTLGGGISSGIAAAMTGGGWGALRGEAWLALVQSHGHLQVFGFIALFIMGIAFHVLPRFKALPPPGRGVTLATYWLTTSASPARCRRSRTGGFVRWLLARQVLELAGAALFAKRHRRHVLEGARPPRALDAFVLAALAWFVALAAMTRTCGRCRHRRDRVRTSRRCGAARSHGVRLRAVRARRVDARAAVLPVAATVARACAMSRSRCCCRAALRVAAVWAPQFGNYAGPTT
jgi:hypothetical protein